MADYKAMYYKIFNTVSEVIEELQAAQIEAEAIYVNYEEPKIQIFDTKEDMPDK